MIPPRRLLRAVLSAALLCTLTISASLSAAPPETILEDTWEAVSMGGTRVGYIHTMARSVNGPNPIVVTSIFSETRLKRLGFTMVIRNDIEYREKPDGEILSVLSKSLMSNVETVSTCTPRDGKMHIATRTVGKTHDRAIPWDKSVIGPWAQSKQMRKAELKPGEKVSFKIFLPDLLRVASSSVTIGNRETIAVHGEKRDLIRGTMEQDVLPGVLTTVWMDDEANVVRSFVAIMGGVETIRTTREDALKAIAPKEMADVLTHFAIKSNVKIDKPSQVREALYRIEGDAETIAALSLADRRQVIEKREPTALLLRVRALADAAEPVAEKPGKEFLASSPYVQCTDPLLVRMAKTAAGDAATPYAKAKRLETWVYRKIKKKDYSIGFASAKEVAMSRQGDCTEHSVLLAALLRAQGIPSRMAVGVVYWNGIFGYHMWTEAFLNDWTALDATLGGKVVDATHIQFASGALDKPSAISPFVSLVPIIGKVKLTVIEVVK